MLVFHWSAIQPSVVQHAAERDGYGCVSCANEHGHRYGQALLDAKSRYSRFPVYAGICSVGTDEVGTCGLLGCDSGLHWWDDVLKEHLSENFEL